MDPNQLRMVTLAALLELVSGCEQGNQRVSRNADDEAAPPSPAHDSSSSAPGAPPSATRLTATPEATSETPAPVFEPPVETSEAPPAIPEEGARLDDAQIAGVLQAASDAEVAHGKLARLKGRRASVKALAATLLAHYGEAQRTQAELGISTAESALANRVGVASNRAAERLKNAGGDFDRRYLDTQVEAHRRAISAIDQQLLPNVRSPQLRAYIDAQKSDIVIHLAQLERVRRDLAGANPRAVPSSPPATGAAASIK